MKKYVLYARLSTKERGIYGIETQIERMNKYVEDQKEEILEVFQERESGNNDNRPLLAKAIELCIQEKAILLIASIDRLSRSVGFIFNLKHELEKNNIPFEVADMPALSDYPPSTRTIYLGMMSTFAQSERERISERVRIGMGKAFASGKTTIKKNLVVTKEQIKKRTLTIKRQREALCQKVETVLKNILPHINGKTETVALMLNREGLRTLEGSLWTKQALINYGFKLRKLKSLGMIPAARILSKRCKKRRYNDIIPTYS